MCARLQSQRHVSFWEMASKSGLVSLPPAIGTHGASHAWNASRTIVLDLSRNEVVALRVDGFVKVLRGRRKKVFEGLRLFETAGAQTSGFGSANCQLDQQVRAGDRLNSTPTGPTIKGEAALDPPLSALDIGFGGGFGGGGGGGGGGNIKWGPNGPEGGIGGGAGAGA
ncbi:hypothetical protein HK102_005778, partial [Quaeritorhiza haematococci]